jgi:hypothetical protein
MVGDVYLWLKSQVQSNSHKLLHGVLPITTTGFSFQLLNARETWHLLNLYGCTAVIILSRKRMYMMHIWEQPTMMSLQLVDTDVLGVLYWGSLGVPQALRQLIAPGQDFENTLANNLHAFIITPYGSDPSNPFSSNNLRYPQSVDRIKQYIYDLLGGVVAMTIPYNSRWPDENFDNPYGKVLIQYDPYEAIFQPATGGCTYQAAGIELWFEDLYTHRYRDVWVASPSQRLPADVWPLLASSDGQDIRVMKGKNVTEADEEAWKEYEALMLGEGGGSCPLPSEVASSSLSTPVSSTLWPSLASKSSPASSIPSASSTSSKPSTFQTSLTVTSTSKKPISASTSTPSSTSSPIVETSTQPAPPSDPPPSPVPSKALSIILVNQIITPRHEDPNGTPRKAEDFNFWVFFEMAAGSKMDGCLKATYVDRHDHGKQWRNATAVYHPDFAIGSFTFKLFGEDCQYLSNVDTPGFLHCPSFGEGVWGYRECKGDPEKNDPGATTTCYGQLGYSKRYHRVAICER